MSRLATVTEKRRGSQAKNVTPKTILVGTGFINRTLTRILSSLLGPQAIVAVNTGTETLSVLGDLTDKIKIDDNIVVAGSTGNDGQKTVTAVVFNTPNTDITVAEDITDATVDGTIQVIENVVEVKRTTESEEVIVREIDTALATELNTDDASNSEPVIILTVKKEDSTPVASEPRGIPVNRIWDVREDVDTNDSLVTLYYSSDERGESRQLVVDQTVAQVKALANA